jgi:hypothetical protein
MFPESLKLQSVPKVVLFRVNEPLLLVQPAPVAPLNVKDIVDGVEPPQGVHAGPPPPPLTPLLAVLDVPAPPLDAEEVVVCVDDDDSMLDAMLDTMLEADAEAKEPPHKGTMVAVDGTDSVQLLESIWKTLVPRQLKFEKLVM